MARKVWWGGVMSVVMAVQVVGQEPEPPSGPEHHASVEITVASRQNLGQGVTQARLSSGLTILIRENHSAPVATVRCFIHQTGSAFEGKFLGAGLSHLLEHLVAGGTTTKRSEDEIRALMDKLGGQTNAYTSDDVTAFYIDCPAKQVDLAIDLIAENMQFSLIPEKEFRREMGVVQRELEMGEADRSRMLYNTMKQLLFTEHPVRHPTIGYISVVQQVSREQVIEFYKDRYVPQNMLFVVAGDVKTDEVLDRVVKNFKTFQRTTERRVDLPVEPAQASPRSTRLEMDGPTTHWAIAWPTVPLQHPDLYALDVASHILTNGDSSRLNRRLVLERPIANNVTSASYTPGFVPGWFQVVAEFKPDNGEVAIDIINEEIEKLKTTLVAPAELAKAKRQKAAEHVFQQQKVENQAEILASSYLSTGDPLFDDQYVAGIQKVTAEQVRDVAVRYFLPERLNTVRIDPVGTRASEKTAVAAEGGETPFTRKQLPNGLTVLVKRNPAVPMVSLQVYAKAGAMADTPQSAGLASLASAVMERGTKSRSAADIADFFDRVGGTLSVQSQRNSSFVQAAVLKDDFAEAWDVVSEIVAQPTFPEEEFAKVKELQLSRIAARVGNPQTEIMDFWTAQLPADAPFGRTILGTTATVSKLTAADAKKFHQTYFAPANLVVAIVGDIDPAAALAAVEKTLGKLPKGSAPKWPKFAAAEPMKTDVVKTLTNQKKGTAMVLFGYPAGSVYDKEQRAVLEVLGAVLTGGGGAGGRLHEELRGERLVYYVFGFQAAGFAPGYYHFLAQTRPDTLDEVVSRIKANLAKIAKEGIPADEFAKAKEKLIANHAMSNTTASEQAFQTAIDELYGLGYDYDRGYDARIDAVTIEQVTAYVQKFMAHGLLATSAPAETEAAGEE